MNIFDPTQVSGPKKKIIKVPKRGLKGGQKRWKCTFKGKNLIVVLSSTHLNTGDFHLCITSENINFFDPSEVTRPKNITKLSKIRLKGGQKHEDVHPKGKTVLWSSQVPTVILRIENYALPWKKGSFLPLHRQQD